VGSRREKPVMIMKAPGKLLLTFIATGLLWSANAGADDRELEIYPLYSPDAAAIINVVESTIGPSGKVIYDKSGSRLLVLADREAHVDVAAIMKKVNVPPVNVRINLVMRDEGRITDSGFAIRGSGEVVVTPDDTDVNVSVRPEVRSRSTRTGRNTRQSLLIQSGTEGVLKVGAEVPFLHWLTNYGVNRGYIVEHVEMREVGAFLRVQARVIGDGPLISLKLTPELSGLAGEGQQQVKFTHLSTDLTVRDGQTISLGGLEEDSEFYRKFLVGVDSRGNRRELRISVTPTIEAPAAP